MGFTLKGSISGVNSPDHVEVDWITHSWVLASVNVERLECNVCFPLVLWLEVSIFSVSRAVWVYNASAGVMTASWPVLNLLHHSTPLFSGYLPSVVPLGYIKYLHRQNQTWTRTHRLLPFSQQRWRPSVAICMWFAFDPPASVCNVRRPN